MHHECLIYQEGNGKGHPCPPCRPPDCTCPSRCSCESVKQKRIKDLGERMKRDPKAETAYKARNKAKTARMRDGTSGGKGAGGKATRAKKRNLKRPKGIVKRTRD